MTKKKVSKAQVKANQKVSRKHGVRAFQTRGEAALDPAQKSHYVEILQKVETREGAVELLKDRTAKAVLMADLGQAWIKLKHDKGEAILEQPIMQRYTTLQAEARRSLIALLAVLPDYSQAIDAELIKIDKAVEVTQAEAETLSEIEVE